MSAVVMAALSSNLRVSIQLIGIISAWRFGPQSLPGRMSATPLLIPAQLTNSFLHQNALDFSVGLLISIWAFFWVEQMVPGLKLCSSMLEHVKICTTYIFSSCSRLEDESSRRRSKRLLLRCVYCHFTFIEAIGGVITFCRWWESHSEDVYVTRMFSIEYDTSRVNPVHPMLHRPNSQQQHNSQNLPYTAFSIFNNIFLGYFDPVNIDLYYKKKRFSGLN